MRNLLGNIFLALFLLFSSHLQGIEIKKVKEFANSEKFVHGEKSIVFHHQFIYILSYSGLLVYRNIESSDRLEFVSKTILSGVPSSLSIHSDLLFLSLQGGFDKIYKIDVKNPYIPVVKDSLMINGSYKHFIKDNCLYINNLKTDNSWSLLKYDLEFNLISKFEVPHKYWAIDQINDSLLYIQKFDSLFLYIIDKDKLNLVFTIIDSLTNPIGIKLIKDSVLVISSNLYYTKLYQLNKRNNWELIANLSPAENFIYFKNNLYLKSKRRIRIFDLTNPITPQIVSEINQINYISSFIVFDNYVLTASDNNKLTLYRRNNGDFFSCFSSDYARIISSAIMDSLLFFETIDNNLYVWNISKICFTPDTIIKTNGYCINLNVIEEQIQRVFYDYSGHQMFSQFLIYDKLNNSFLIDEIDQYRGQINKLEENTFVSFFKQYIFKYLYKNNSLIIVDSTKLLNSEYANICTEGFNIFIGTKNYITYIKYLGSDSFQYVDHTTTFIEYPEIQCADNFLFISDNHCKNDCAVYSFTDKMNLVSTLNSSGKYCSDTINKLFFIGCNSNIVIYSYKDVFTKGMLLVEPSLVSDYTENIGLHNYKSNNEYFLINVKESGVNIFKY